MPPSPVAQTSSEETTSSPPTGEPSPRSGADHTRLHPITVEPQETGGVGDHDLGAHHAHADERGLVDLRDRLPLPRRIRTGQALGADHPHRPVRRHRHGQGQRVPQVLGGRERAASPARTRRRTGARRARNGQAPRRWGRPPSPRRTQAPRARRWRSTGAVEPHHRLLQLAVGEHDLPDRPDLPLGVDGGHHGTVDRVVPHHGPWPARGARHPGHTADPHLGADFDEAVDPATLATAVLGRDR